jgi:transcription initiation factor TFIIE subunit alpha
VRRWLIGTIGEHAIHIIQDFETPMSDEQIAQKTGVRASDVRIVLNKLHSYGLAIYTRSRDKNSGWYSYVWRFTDDHINEVMQQIKKGEGERTVISDGEGGEFYQCSACGSDKIFDFGHAVDLQFKCDRCGGDLKFVELKDAKKGED